MLSIAHDGTPEFEAGLARLRGRGAEDLEAVTPVVREILADVRRTGDEAVRRYVEVLERRKPERLVMSPYDGEAALGRLEASRRAALVLAADRITRYHERQRDLGFGYEEEGVGLRMRVRPLARVGVYAPGGKARYPSSVLMTAIPARVAGVRDIVLATPGLGGADRAGDDLLLAAAHLAGVTAILDAGGAHAIAALAYGTASVPRVDKIVGPGNAYVACAKRLVYGEVDIDGIAGPSEVLVVADEGADPALCAADLLAQAEHDEAAYPMMVTTSRAIAEATAREVDLQLETQPRRAIIEASLSRALLLVVADRARAAAGAAPRAPPPRARPRPPPHATPHLDGPPRPRSRGRRRPHRRRRRRARGRAHAGGRGRLPRRSVARPADGRVGPLRLAARRVRLRGAVERHPLLARGAGQPRAPHRGAGAGRGARGACPLRRAPARPSR